MKSLFFIIMIALHAKDLKAQVTPNDIVINMKTRFFSDLESFVEICRGIVIHPKVVMTAAECVNGLSPADLQIENLSHKDSFNVLNIIIHPKYREDNASNNFAILIIDRIIVTRNSVACLSNGKFLNNADLKKCSTSLITEHLHQRMSLSSGEPYSALDCKLDDEYKENPHMFRRRQVQMVHCKPIPKNSECSTYYFAHYSSNKKCLLYTNKINVIDLSTSFVNDVYHWVQEQIWKYVHDDSVCL